MAYFFLLCCLLAGVYPVAATAQSSGDVPALLTLARQAAPPDPVTGEDLLTGVAAATKAGDYYAQAYAIKPDLESAEGTAKQYLQVYDWTRVAQGRFQRLMDINLPAARAQAIVWLDRAKQLGSAQAWTNYGVLFYTENKLDEARAAFEQGARLDNAMAHWYLGEMDVKTAPAAALRHYERALELGYSVANEGVLDALLQTLENEYDTDALGRGLQRLEQMEQASDKSYDIDKLIHRYNRGRMLQEEKKHAGPLPNLPVYLNACPLKSPAPERMQYEVEPGRTWIISMDGVELDGWEVRGKMDRNGCARLSRPLPAAVRSALARGGVVTLTLTTVRLPLAWKAGKQRIDLVTRPFDEGIQ